MLLLTLIIYLILWFPYRVFVVPILPIVESLPLILAPIALFVFSFFVAWLVGFFVNAYSPARKAQLRRLTSNAGVKIICTVTWLLIGGLFLYSYLGWRFDKNMLGLISPVFLVSLLNSLGIHIPDRRLEEDEPIPRMVTPPTFEPPTVPEGIVREYHWQHEGNPYDMRVVFRTRLYEECRAKDRVPIKKWAEEYVAGGICGEVREIAHRLLTMGNPYGTYQEVSFILSFVQNIITYERDEGGDYPKYPVETLVDATGDCEDFSILAAAILKTMGYDVALLFVPGHAALGVVGADGLEGAYAEHEGKRYYYCEMTASGWKIGQISEKRVDQEIKVQPIPGIVVARTTE